MVLGCLVAMLASLGVALETTYKGYMIFRFLQGWGVGPASTVGLQMLGELYRHNQTTQSDSPKRTYTLNTSVARKLDTGAYR
jgi:MFS family permease